MARKRDERQAQESREAGERERAAQAGREALAQQAAIESVKSVEEKAAEEEEALRSAGAAAAAEAARAEAAREVAERAVKDLPPNTRLLKAGTILHLHGEEAVLAVDAPVTIAHASDEQYFAALLSRDAKNLALNSDALRLVYSPMNGAPLPPGSQRLKPEEMTPEERAVFGIVKSE